MVSNPPKGVPQIYPRCAYQDPTAAGATVVMELEDRPWGDRRYEVLDIEGHRWYFAEHVRDVDPEEWRGAQPSSPSSPKVK